MNKNQPARRIHPRRAYVVSANGLKRIRLGEESGETASLPIRQPVPTKPFRTTQSTTTHFLVMVQSDRGELDEHAREVIAAAALLANEHTAVVVAVFGEASAPLLAKAGADKVIVLPEFDQSLFCPLQWLSVANILINRYQPNHIFMPDRQAEGDFGRRLAARMQKTVATDIVELGADYVLRTIPGGKYARSTLPYLLLLARYVADTWLPFVGHGKREAAPDWDITIPFALDKGIEKSSAEEIELEEADFILSAGNGMRDFGTFTTLAQSFNASVGASRVAVDEGHFPRDRQIGATGKTVQPSVYMALGISGAVQHLQGIKECRHVIAVNVDASAPIAKRADLMVVEDAEALMKALVQQIQQAKMLERENAT